MPVSVVLSSLPPYHTAFSISPSSTDKADAGKIDAGGEDVRF
jgi:hypothetical protein